MIEFLTTGQMIDRLKVGEVAESNDKKWSMRWNDYGMLVLNLLENKGGRNEIYLSDIDRKWRILPKYVSFNEAMDALKDGKDVKFRGVTFDDEMRVLPVDAKMTAVGSMEIGNYGLFSLYDGRWSINE